MLAIFELLLILLNTIVLSSIYASLTLLLLFIVSKISNNQWIKRNAQRKIKFWLSSHFLISLGLLCYVFSYSQDTGIGDNSKIPIGYGQTIQSEDFAWTYFYPDPNKTQPNRDEIKIEHYKITNDILCAEISDLDTRSPNYRFIVYNLKNRTSQVFTTEREYSDYAIKNSLPLKSKFYDFRTHYHEYLNNRPRWRKWLLP